MAVPMMQLQQRTIARAAIAYYYWKIYLNRLPSDFDILDEVNHYKKYVSKSINILCV